MKILITNIVTLNGGDAAILFAEMDLLRAAFGKDTEFVIYDSQPEVASRYYPHLSFRKLIYLNLRVLKRVSRIRFLGRLLHYTKLSLFYFSAWCWIRNMYFFPKLLLTKEEQRDLAEYSSADLIVSTGGTILVENYNLNSRIFDYRVSLLMRKPLIFFTQSLGPFLIPYNRKYFARIFGKAILILLRDIKSKENLMELGLNNSNIHVTADAAFALGDAAKIENSRKATSNFSAYPKIAISVRYWRHFKTLSPDVGRNRYYQALGALTVHLVHKHNARITYISSCQGIPAYWADDSKIAMQIIRSLPLSVQNSVRVNRDFHNPKDLVAILQNYHFVISTRLHVAILALIVGIPVLPIAYEFKTHQLFKRLGQACCVQDIEKMSSESLIRSVDTFIDSLPEIRSALFGEVEKERQRALGTVGIVKRAFNQWKQSQRGL